MPNDLPKPGDRRWNSESGVFEVYREPPGRWTPIGPDFDRLQRNLSQEERDDLLKDI